MKKIIIISLIILFASATFGQEGWQWQNPYPQGNNLNSLIMNGVMGWAVGDEGTVMRTENSGYDWEVVDIGTSEDLNCIYIDVISGRGWIAGNKGVIYYTDDNGETWLKQNSGTHQDLNSVTGIGGECIWVCGDDVILHAFHYGDTWEKINTVFHTNFYSVDQKDCDEIWISGKQGRIISTKDAGLTWQAYLAPTTYNLFSIDIVANGDYRACGHMAVILKSSDGGNTWVKENEISLQELNDIDTKGIIGPAYAVGRNGLILETLDGGTNWTQKKSPTINTLNDVCFQALFDAVYATGWYGIILRKEDQADAEIEIMNKRPLLYMQSVEFINESEGWAVGGDKVELSGTREGIILHTSDGGITWEEQLNVPIMMSGLDFINEKEGWATGNNGTIKHTTNGGESWVTQNCPIWGLVNSIHFVDENNGWAVSTDNWGEIAHTSDGGNTWTLQPAPSIFQCADVFFVNANTGWVVGMDSAILHTTNGGETWVRCHLDLTEKQYFKSVYFIDELTGWVAGTYGIVMLTKDGGISWQEINSGFPEHLYSIFFIDPENGWAVGNEGTIIRSIDGGYTWFEQYSGVSRNYLLSVHFVNKMKGWVTGEGGTIIKTENGGFWNEPGTFLRNRLNLPITDMHATRDTLLFEISDKKAKNSGYQLAGLEVMIDSVIHTRASDLEISLSHNGVTVTLVNQITDQGSNFLWTRFSDNAPKTISNGVAPFSGNHKPDNPLSSFNGLDPYGEWILTIYDSQTGHTGTLNAWGIKPLFEKMIPVGKPEVRAAKPEIQLFQNVPNPFTGRTEIKWISDINGFTSLKVYNINGQEIITLVDKILSKGEYSVEFDGTQFSAGVYYYQVRVGDYTITKRCIVM